MNILILLMIHTSSAQDELPSYGEIVPTTPAWRTARRRMYQIWEGHRTLFCGCLHKNKIPDLTSCGLQGHTGSRWERTEAEHVVPISAIGITRPCWEEGGRSLCLREDPVFKAAHNDLHNLVPEIGQLNAYRGNKPVGIVEGEPRKYGSCDFEIDEESDRMEPRRGARGDVARMYFYMEWMYGLQISPGQRRLLMHWHQSDPVDDWERELDKTIEAKQGNSNPFVR